MTSLRSRTQNEWKVYQKRKQILSAFSLTKQSSSRSLSHSLSLSLEIASYVRLIGFNAPVGSFCALSVSRTRAKIKLSGNARRAPMSCVASFNVNVRVAQKPVNTASFCSPSYLPNSRPFVLGWHLLQTG